MKFDLSDRLTRFSASVLELSEKMLDTQASNHLREQLIRSATAPSLMYGEADAAESRADFVHKMSMGLKELRETYNCLQIIRLRNYSPDTLPLENLLDENRQLIAIFGSSINTAKRNMKH